MDSYEIRILSEGYTQTLIECMHLNDHAAIRAARKFAAGKEFEVWRGLDCVYGGPTRPASAITPAPRP